MTARRVFRTPSPALAPAAAETDFRQQAACRTIKDPDLFFPVGETGSAVYQADDAKAVCSGACPVLEQCLRWALDTDQQYGIWGGTTPGERRAMRRAAVRRVQGEAA
ncbi:WhiB family transcriptional regulator [Streptomyces uncialis]|uniref:WhiB family transcriptional regulator n=1 Tax=Streptomyces uncialis TaxID=1048205 RepID=UPI0037893575